MGLTDSVNYYTPKIEEFRVGFEFEFQDEDGDWIYKKLDQKNIQDFFILYNEKIKPKFRVKYLDKKDIEMLGFQFVGDYKFTQFLDKPLYTRVTHIYLQQGNFYNKSLVTVHKDGNQSSGTIHKFVNCIYNKVEIKNKFEFNEFIKRINLKPTEI